jgi:sn-glycerol 3-phosphate transport system permease protein
MPGLTLPLIASATATLPVPPVLPDHPGRAAGGGARRRRRPCASSRISCCRCRRTNIAALFVILFIYGWTQYLWPLLVTTDNDMNTIVIGIKR